jgi:hypothetical protein
MEKSLRGLDSKPVSDIGVYAPTASRPPSGRKYSVPLIRSVPWRNSSCKSSLRLTKSMSEVFARRQCKGYRGVSHNFATRMNAGIARTVKTIACATCIQNHVSAPPFHTNRRLASCGHTSVKKVRSPMM